MVVRRIAEFACLALIVAGLASPVAARAASEREAPAGEPGRKAEQGPFDQLEYRYIGPPGNRLSAVVGVPGDPNVYYAGAASGGVWKSTDGGRIWEQVLFVEENTGVSDLAMDPTNPRILFAGTWQIDIKTWGRQSGGPGSGLYVSRDGGTSWEHLAGHGLPEPPLGKFAVAVAASDPLRVYALIETSHRGSLWRSNDGGEEWKKFNDSRLLNERLEKARTDFRTLYDETIPAFKETMKAKGLLRLIPVDACRCCCTSTQHTLGTNDVRCQG